MNFAQICQREAHSAENNNLLYPIYVFLLPEMIKFIEVFQLTICIYNINTHTHTHKVMDKEIQTVISKTEFGGRSMTLCPSVGPCLGCSLLLNLHRFRDLCFLRLTLDFDL